jgi:uncharacterized protein YbaR (Trm112 family)
MNEDKRERKLKCPYCKKILSKIIKTETEEITTEIDLKTKKSKYIGDDMADNFQCPNCDEYLDYEEVMDFI